MTQEWLEEYKLLKFRKIKKRIEKFPSLNASSNPMGERGPPEAALKRVSKKFALKFGSDFKE